MQRVNRSSAVVTMPAPPAGGTPGYFTGGNPGGGTPPTTPGYEWFNGVQEELMGLILRGGITGSNADLAQVRKSLDRLFGGGLATYAANTTLTVDDAGLVLVNASGGARTITLPAANALAGRPIRFQIEKTDSTANTVTVQRAGTDTIEGATSVVLSGQWASVTLVSDGAGAWVALRPNNPAATSGVAGITRYATAAEADAGTLSDVAVTPASLGIATRNYANPGYARLPGGLIIQWGVTNSGDAHTTLTATFPIAFPNAVLHLGGTPKGNGGNGAFAMYENTATLTGCTFTLGEWASLVQNASVAYLAIGR
jgi:hypothetical protein